MTALFDRGSVLAGLFCARKCQIAESMKPRSMRAPQRVALRIFGATTSPPLKESGLAGVLQVPTRRITEAMEPD
jgi:hypothetical protein